MKFSSALISILAAMAVAPTSAHNLRQRRSLDTSTVVVGGGVGVGVGIGGVEDDPAANPDPNTGSPTLKDIDDWLTSEGLNEYGDPDGTMYMGDGPLFDMANGTMKDRYEYLVDRFPHEPWNQVKVLATIDEWLKEENLNEFGDPYDTSYMGSNPLFDMTTGETQDRYEYLMNKFPDEPWYGNDADGASGSMLAVIDAWLESQSYNEFGDPLDTMYMGGNPLFDETTGEMMDRYEYLINKFPDKPWDDPDVSADGSDVSGDKLAAIDAWLESQSYNEFGDPLDTMYMGSNPLFDETTGEMMDRYEYLINKFPDKPWDDTGVDGSDVSGDKLADIDAWLAFQSYNDYGDPLGTMYAGGDPLFDETTGEMMDRYEYLMNKFPDEPWDEPDISLDGDGPRDGKAQVWAMEAKIDAWLESQELNKYGDPLGTMYMGADPLFDETTGETKDRYDYIKGKFPDQPWNNVDGDKGADVDGDKGADVDGDFGVMVTTGQDDGSEENTREQETDSTDNDMTSTSGDGSADSSDNDMTNSNNLANGEGMGVTSGSIVRQLSISSIALSLALIVLVN